MNDVLVLDEGRGRGQEKEQTSLARSSLLLAWLSLGLGLGAGAWIYFWNGRQFSSLVGLLPASAGGALGVLAIMAGARKLQRALLQRLRDKDADCQRMFSDLQVQVAASRRSEECLRKAQAQANDRAGRAEDLNAKLSNELDQFKQAQKAFWQHRQELESSRKVLQLHVQERTGELHKLQSRYELILNSAGEGICGLDLDGKATFVNPAASKITGCKIGELIGKTEEEIFGRNGATAGAGSKDRTSGERIFHRPDGTCLPLEYEKTLIHESGRELGAVIVFRDISERKRVEEAITQKAEELARSNAELEQFAFVASHDLQEPLRKIQAFGDRLKTKIKGEIAAEAVDYLERMQNAAARMRTLINDLLTFSRVIRKPEGFVPVELAAVAKGVLGDLEMRIEKSGAQLEVGDLPVVDADPVQMHQLLLNLLGNALKFQPAGAKPVVKIRSRAFRSLSGEQICELIVEDNGIGFEEKYLEKIFTVFQRLHGRNEYEGTGVGLAVCRRITDRHHGTITARSQLGQGATFLVTLPLHQPKESFSA